MNYEKIKKAIDPNKNTNKSELSSETKKSVGAAIVTAPVKFNAFILKVLALVVEFTQILPKDNDEGVDVSVGVAS